MNIEIGRAVLQVERADGWRNLTSHPYDQNSPKHEFTKEFALAYLAKQQMQWQKTDSWETLKYRIVLLLTGDVYKVA